MLAKIVLITVAVVATAGIGQADQQADESFRKLFVSNHRHMGWDETRDILDDIARAQNGEIMSLINKYLPITEYMRQQCTDEHFRSLDNLIRWLRIGNEDEGWKWDDEAEKVRVHLAALIKVCGEEMQTMFDWGMSTMKDESKQKVKELVQSGSDPSGLAKFVMNKAGKEAIQTKKWFKNEFDAEKYEQAYKEHVIRPCNKYRESFVRAASIADILKNRQNLDDNMSTMLKTMKFCAASGNKIAGENSFTALKSL